MAGGMDSISMQHALTAVLNNLPAFQAFLNSTSIGTIPLASPVNMAANNLPSPTEHTLPPPVTHPKDAGGTEFPPLLSSILATGTPNPTALHGNYFNSFPPNSGNTNPSPLNNNAPPAVIQPPNDTPAPSFAAVLRPIHTGPLDPENLVPPSMKPVRKGLYLTVAIDDALRAKGIEELRGTFIAHITHAKTEIPLAKPELASRLSELWNLNSHWSMVHLGKRYYNIMIENLEDRDRIFRRRTWSIKPGFMRLMPWVPNFDPYNVNTSVAQVWIRLFQLPLEYWQEPILVALASAVGTVIRLDDVTRRKESAHFARVLVEVDLKKDLEEYVMIESSGHRSYVMIQYERLPSYCRNCAVIGHDTGDCFSRNQTNNKPLDKGPHTYTRPDKRPASTEKNDAPQGEPTGVNTEPVSLQNQTLGYSIFEVGGPSGVSPSPAHVDSPAQTDFHPPTCLPQEANAEPPPSNTDYLEESPNLFALLATDTDGEDLQEGFPNDPLNGETGDALVNSSQACQVDKPQKKRGRKKKQPATEQQIRPYNLRNNTLEEASRVVRESTNGNFVVETGSSSLGLLEMTRVNSWADECERSTPPKHGSQSVIQ
ncbi:hypothetical protein ACS0TY_006522 [Phlomoides rotata]